MNKKPKFKIGNKVIFSGLTSLNGVGTIRRISFNDNVAPIISQRDGKTITTIPPSFNYHVYWSKLKKEGMVTSHGEKYLKLYVKGNSEFADLWEAANE